MLHPREERIVGPIAEAALRRCEEVALHEGLESKVPEEVASYWDQWLYHHCISKRREREYWEMVEDGRIPKWMARRLSRQGQDNR